MIRPQVPGLAWCSAYSSYIMRVWDCSGNQSRKTRDLAKVPLRAVIIQQLHFPLLSLLRHPYLVYKRSKVCRKRKNRPPAGGARAHICVHTLFSFLMASTN